MSDTDEKQVAMATEPLLAWTSHPAKQRPLAAALTALFILVIAIGIYTWTYSPLFTTIGTIVLAGSLAGFFFPTRYRFYEDRVEVNYTVTTMKKDWSAFRSYHLDRNGVLLSPFLGRSRLENYRGLFIRFGAHDRKPILEIVERKIPKETDAGS